MESESTETLPEAPESATTDAETEEAQSQDSQEAVSNIDATSQESFSDDPSYQNQEFLQRKLYFLLEHLKKMHSTVPE